MHCNVCFADENTFRHAGISEGNFCAFCGAMLEETFRVKAPTELVQLAQEWHNGQSSGLYSLASTGQVYSERVGEIASELRDILRKSEWSGESETIKKWLPWIERLETAASERNPD